MRLTKEQLLAVDCEESVFLTACPGSGKTKVIAAKLGRCLASASFTPRRVACITYTNAAVHEIEARTRRSPSIRDAWALDISTIHSFCLNNIFRSHAFRFNEFRNGFKMLAQDSEEYEALIRETRAAFRKKVSKNDFDEFSQIRRNACGDVVGPSVTSGNISAEEADHFWGLMRERGLVDYGGLLFYSLQLCRKYPEISDHLSARFSWVLVDEFQDTTDLQVEIFKEIHRRKNTRFFLVGDLCQSIFGFAGAAPSLAEEFAHYIGARRDLKLSANFRSSPAIVSDGERVFPRTPPMVARGVNRSVSLSTSFVVADSPTAAVVDFFLPKLAEHRIDVGDSAVLAHSWFKLVPIAKELRARGIPVLGPGARPYRRQRLFATLAERVCGYLSEPDVESLVGVERALYDMLMEATHRAPEGLFTYAGRKLVLQLLGDATTAREFSRSGVAFLHELAARVSARLSSAGYLLASEVETITLSVGEMESDMRKNSVVPEELTIEDLGVFARPKRAVKLLSFHAAKGREFGAVALVGLNEGTIPYYLSTTPEEIEEARRLFYVGITRAEKFLLYSATRDFRNPPSRFLGKDVLRKC
jgi:DNA helicase-2/ATP-dependent DNA helicase PcrA